MTEKQTDTRDVVLEIVGTQRLNGDSDKIELTTVGTLQTEPETLVFRYTEQQEPPEEPIYVQVRHAAKAAGSCTPLLRYSG